MNAPDGQTLDDHLATRLLHQRVVLLGGELDDGAAHRLTAQLLLLSAEDPKAELALWITSSGGSPVAALGVHDVLRLLPNDVVTVAAGEVAGPAALLLAAGTRGRRGALPHARVRLTEPAGGVSTGLGLATPPQSRRHAEAVAAGLLAQHARRPAQSLDAERWFSAAEAAAFGLVDQVVDGLDDVRPGALRRVGI